MTGADNTFCGFPACQVWADFWLWERLLNDHPELAGIVELGTAYGGFALYLATQARYWRSWRWNAVTRVPASTFEHADRCSIIAAMKVLCIYLRGPAGTEFDGYYERFRLSYNDHPAGAPHDLVIVPNDTNVDIAVLQRFAADNSHDRILLLSGYARIRAKDWLKLYLKAIAPEDVAAVSASGSYEQGYSSRSPNPHLRTPNLMVKTAVLNELGIAPCCSKRECYEFEHGDGSLYRRIVTMGYRGLVVSTEGSWAEDRWRLAETFRTPGQRHLLISDKHTDIYDHALPEERRDLEHRAWLS